MPIYRTARGLLLYAHVPKCGGAALEDALTERFGRRNTGFLDRAHGAQKKPWSRTSPQHVDARTLLRLFPKGFFDRVFATVRHPATRLRSAFLHQRDIAEALPKETVFHDWLTEVPRLRRQAPHRLDHHILPMSSMIPDGAHSFPLERGLTPVLRWVDGLTGGSGPANGAYVDPPRKAYGERLVQAGRSAGPDVSLTQADCDLIYDMDRVDYDRFGYARDVGTRPDVVGAGWIRGPRDGA